jgi:hypothetical protein
LLDGAEWINSVPPILHLMIEGAARKPEAGDNGLSNEFVRLFDQRPVEIETVDA